MTNEPDIRNAVTAGAEFLLRQNVRMLPVDAAALAYGCGWRVKSYTQMADKLNISLSDVIETYGTQDAFTACRRQPVIFFNDTVRSRERILFSLCHEMGHIVLGHFNHETNQSLTDGNRRILDLEAHAFACSMMAPAPVASEIASGMAEGARKLFGLSHAAWEIRLSTITRDIAYLGDACCGKLLEQFRPWLQSLRCASCGAMYAGRACPACGTLRPLPTAASWQHAHNPVMSAPYRLQRGRKGVPMLEAELDNPML